MVLKNGGGKTYERGEKPFHSHSEVFVEDLDKFLDKLESDFTQRLFMLQGQMQAIARRNKRNSLKSVNPKSTSNSIISEGMVDGMSSKAFSLSGFYNEEKHFSSEKIGAEMLPPPFFPKSERHDSQHFPDQLEDPMCNENEWGALLSNVDMKEVTKVGGHGNSNTKGSAVHYDSHNNQDFLNVDDIFNIEIVESLNVPTPADYDSQQKESIASLPRTKSGQDFKLDGGSKSSISKTYASSGIMNGRSDEISGLVSGLVNNNNQDSEDLTSIEERLLFQLTNRTNNSLGVGNMLSLSAIAPPQSVMNNNERLPQTDNEMRNKEVVLPIFKIHDNSIDIKKTSKSKVKRQKSQ